MTDDPVFTWECETCFLTNNPLRQRLQETLKERGTAGGFLIAHGGEGRWMVRWTTRAVAPDPAVAVGMAAAELVKAFKDNNLDRYDLEIIESTAVRR